MPNRVAPEQVSAALGQPTAYQAVPGRWPVDKIQAWYDALPWLSGTNYYPATAINQIDMWQASTWDPETIEKEMQWSEELGFNTHRVYLHDLVWADDEAGLYARMDWFLDCCVRHKCRPFFVFFDDCHFPTAQLGDQPAVIPAYHNSGWLTCPRRDTAIKFSKGEASADEIARLKGYVQRTMEHFRDDERILCWELYNEPGRGDGDQENAEHRGDLGYEGFGDGSCKLVHESWVWARAVAPTQPICSTSDGCVGDMNWTINAMNSDMHSIHNYAKADNVRAQVERWRQDDARPLLMTEYMARTTGSTFQDIMPVLKELDVAAINWGFVAGKSGTIWPWSSRERDGVFQDADKLRAAGEVLAPGDSYPEPDLWFHDIMREDGSPFAADEITCIKQCNNP